MTQCKTIRDRVQDEGMRLLEALPNRRVYERSDEEGYARMISHPVFDGVDVIYKDVIMDSITHTAMPLEGYFEIHFCADGRIGCTFEANSALVMNRGDVAIGWKQHKSYRHTTFFPTGRFRGISLGVYIPKAQAAIDRFIGVGILDLTALCKSYCGDYGYGRINDTAAVRAAFESLYHVPKSLGTIYIQLKCIEIFVLLASLGNQSDCEAAYYNPNQVEIVRRIHDRIATDVTQYRSIDELAMEYRLSPTALKRCFKSLYGMTIYQYVKSCRMRAAAKDLCESGDTVLSIANRWGYENSSKFSVAFKQVMGVNPSEYRVRYK